MGSKQWTSALAVAVMLAMTVPALAQTTQLPDRIWFPAQVDVPPAIVSSDLGSPVIDTPAQVAPVVPVPQADLFGPNTVVSGEVRGGDLILKFPDNTLGYTVSFNATGLRVPQAVVSNSLGIDWINTSELRVSMAMLQRGGGSLDNLWVSAQLRSGEALLQRVHFPTPTQDVLTDNRQM